MYLAAAADDSPLILLALDLSWWRSVADELELRRALLQASALSDDRLIVHVSHTHAAPSTFRGLADRPGGHLIGAFREQIERTCVRLISAARGSARPAILSWAKGSCHLAFNRQFVSPADGAVVVGLNPAAKADDTLLVGRVADAAGTIYATLVNYACHPTSLGGANRLISPDYVGAMRETIEKETGGVPCVFLHGASGDLTPRRSFEADVAAAERNGLEIGHAALGVLASMYPPGIGLEWIGIEESGTKLAVWRERPFAANCAVEARQVTVPLAVVDMPSKEELQRAIADATQEYVRERLRRKLGLRETVGDGQASDFRFLVWRLGDAFLVALPAEAHSSFQMQLRSRFPAQQIAVLNIANGYLSYVPPREDYTRNTYQAQVAIYKSGAAECILSAAGATIATLLEPHPPR
ncbi:MAG TPA: hypothetical protein VIY54_07505 [Steroidobacteraceae bacterium]